MFDAKADALAVLAAAGAAFIPGSSLLRISASFNEPALFYTPSLKDLQKVLCKCVQVRLDGQFSAVHAVADMRRSVCLTDLCLCYVHG